MDYMGAVIWQKQTTMNTTGEELLWVVFLILETVF